MGSGRDGQDELGEAGWLAGCNATTVWTATATGTDVRTQRRQLLAEQRLFRDRTGREGADNVWLVGPVGYQGTFIGRCQHTQQHSTIQYDTLVRSDLPDINPSAL